MPPKQTSSRARHSKQPIAPPRRGRASAATNFATSPPSTRTRSRTNPPSVQTTSKANPASHRTRSTTISSTPPEPVISCGPQTTSSPVPAGRIGIANSNTPNRRSAAGTPSGHWASSRNSRASYTPQTDIATAAPRAATQLEMDVYIESELHNAIFHDPNFLGRFLSGTADKLQDIELHCRTNN